MIRVRACGRLKIADSDVFLVCREGTNLFRLEENEVLAVAEIGAPVEVSGTVVSVASEEAAESLPLLALTSVAEASEDPDHE